LVCAPEPTSITDAYSLVKSVKERGENMPKFKIVVNRVESKEEGDIIFNNLQKVAKRFLSVDMTHLGTIPYDTNLIKAVKQQNPCLMLFPNTAFSKEIENIGNKILDLKMEKAPTGMKGFMKRMISIFYQ
jgi:flagellar biosynthesis protein FlhG